MSVAVLLPKDAPQTTHYLTRNPARYLRVRRTSTTHFSQESVKEQLTNKCSTPSPQRLCPSPEWPDQ